MTAPVDLSCREFVELVTDHLDGALDAATRAAFAAHLVVCAGCLAYLEQIRFTVRALGALTSHTLDAEAAFRLVLLFRGRSRSGSRL